MSLSDAKTHPESDRPVSPVLPGDELSDRDLEAVAAGTSTECQRDQTGSSINVKRR